MASGGEGGAWGVGGGFKGREGGRKWLFYVVGRICSLQHSPLQKKFEDDPTVNESGMTILLK